MIAIFLLLGLAVAASPGTQVTIFNKAFDEIIAVLLPYINEEYNSMPLPDIHADTHVPAIGHITIDLKDLLISNFHIDTATILAQEPNHLSVAFTGVSIEVSGHWKWRRVHSPHTSDSGTFKAHPKHPGSLALVVEVSVDSSKGVPQLKTVSATCKFDHWEFTFHKSPISWLYDLFTSVLSGSISKAVDKAVEQTLTSLVDTTANAYLLTIPTEIEAGGGSSKIDIDISTLSLTATSDFLSLSNNFAVSNPQTGDVCPETPAALPKTDAIGSAMQIMVAASDFSCPLWSDFHNHALDFFENTTTTAWKVWLPILYTKWPDKKMDLAFTPHSQPKLSMSNSTGLQGSAVYNMSMSVLIPEPTWVATLSVKMDFAIDISLDTISGKTILHGSCGKLQLAVAVEAASIAITAAELQLIAAGISPLLQKGINFILQKGFEIPLGQGVTLVNPRFAFRENYLAIGSDVGFAPPSLALRDAKNSLEVTLASN